MNDRGSYGLSPRLDIQQLLLEAKHRWLRPAEICEILRNYKMFQIESESPHSPQSGSLFLFDRKVLRYFRKDGHNWRKKKDGKTVKEAHEKLKVGSIDVLHCYYAHGEENENFQRRCYWMLEEDLMHIVFVHYLEVKGTRTNVGSPRGTDVSSSRKSSPTSTSFSKSHAISSSGYLDSPGTTSSMTSLCEDADSEDGYHATSNIHSFPELVTGQTGSSPLLAQKNIGFPEFYYQRPVTVSVAEQSQPAQTDGLINFDDYSREIDSQKALGTASWEEILQQCTSGSHSGQSAVTTTTTNPIITSGIVLGQENINSNINFSVDGSVPEDHETSMEVSSKWQIPAVDDSLSFPREHVDQISELETVYNLGAGVSGHRNRDEVFENSQKLHLSHLEMLNEQQMSSNLQYQLANGESQCLMKLNSEKDFIRDGNVSYASTLRQSHLGEEEALKKVDSFSRWISRELGDVDDLRMHPSPGISWSADECGNIHADSSLSPSLSKDQLFSMTDYSPKWSFTDMEPEVLIVGRFLRIHQDVAKCNWSCMFGEVEVPAMVLADGILCCRAPPHSTGQVPFYVTFSNRVACSEVREFQYLAGSVKDVDVTDIYDGGTNELLLHLQLDSLLSLNYHVSPSKIFIDDLDKRNVIRKLIALKEEKDYIVEPNSQEDLIQQEEKKYFFKILMKETLYSWLLHKVVEDGKGPNVWDENGRGVIHLAAALGYDWALKPIVSAGVSVNFRDVNGWTALHWAAHCGREHTVAVLIALGGGAGLVTDPSPEYPLGKTPADLASANGYKGISGFLAESSLTSHLSALTMNDTTQNSEKVLSTKVVHSVSERIASPANDGYLPDELSLKDSLTAVSHATQVADRIHLMFRMQSFQRKQFAKYDGDQFELLDDRTISILAARALKGGQGNGLAHSAAIHIQKKFRGWKKRKEFLLIRQRIVKIQAHVRGHQVRKKYPSMTWSIGIVDTLLRWRRKRSSLRPAVVPKVPTPESMTEEDDDDFLKKGRRQTEERLKKALTRVKSMAQDPQGRDQYRRLLTLVHGICENKVSGMAVTSSENMVDEDMTYLDDILDDDTLMSITFD